MFLCRQKDAARETMTCIFCHSFSRKRHVAYIIKEFYGNRSIGNLKKLAKISDVDIYNTDASGCFHKIFIKNKRYFSSIYSEQYVIGTEL
jgi:hypothetical protein